MYKLTSKQMEKLDEILNTALDKNDIDIKLAIYGKQTVITAFYAVANPTNTPEFKVVVLYTLNVKSTAQKLLSVMDGMQNYINFKQSLDK